MAFEKLFEPIKIGNVKIKNRYAFAPANWIFHDWTGLVNEEELAFVVARVKGGVGLYIYGAVLCCRIGVPVQGFPFIHCLGYEHVPGLAQVAESAHIAGAKIFCQMLMSMGSRCNPMKGVPPIGPTGGIPWEHEVTPMYREIFQENVGRGGLFWQRFMTPKIPRELTTEEIERDIVAETAHNCKFAVLAGFDGIEIHLLDGYLVGEFRSQWRNKRTDKYGGSTENRNRLALEIVEATIRSVKEERADFVVGVRVGCQQAVGGYTIQDTVALAKQLEELGIDYLHMHPGGWPGRPGESFADSKAKDGVYLKYAKEFKKVLKIPVITPLIHDPKLAEQAVSEGWTDMVGSCRPLIADPQFVNKVKENRLADIRRCTKCGYCYIQHPLGLPARCAVNPEVGRERYNPNYWITEGFTGKQMWPEIFKKRPRS